MRSASGCKAEREKGSSPNEDEEDDDEDRSSPNRDVGVLPQVGPVSTVGRSQPEICSRRERGRKERENESVSQRISFPPDLVSQTYLEALQQSRTKRRCFDLQTCIGGEKRSATAQRKRGSPSTLEDSVEASEVENTAVRTEESGVKVWNRRRSLKEREAKGRSLAEKRGRKGEATFVRICSGIHPSLFLANQLTCR